jgi:copper chaperone NosL
LKNILLVCLFVVGLFACSKTQTWPPKPAEVHAGEDSCATCGMIISDEHYGAQLFERNQPVKLFDDYGCLLKRRNRGISNQHLIYVRSFENGKWLPEEQAFFVVSKKISSPMGYGVAAFPEKQSAANFAQKLSDSNIYVLSEIISAAQQIVNAGSQREE